MDDGGIRSEIVMTERFGFGPLKETKCEMRFVVEVKCDLREIDGVDGGWVERMESVPTRF
ncbi:hypothetical protein TSUD_63430 [Trifolium subterraneum]|uniref:Uncharacterized protein n=1 Tax=Trifolium subterraneum TaxID=3900 RepID=A0A2Z6N1A7_TRISU|nr:hypothetical protein TSUD_63430 [Trifolium subterraneum]